MCTLIWNSKLKNQKQRLVACHCHYSISKSPYPRMATALLNSIKNQPRNHYLSTINQLFVLNPKLNFIRNERKCIEDRCSSHISATQRPNAFDDILRLNSYPEKSIEQTKQNKTPNETLNLPTQNGHTLRSRTFLNDSIIWSLTSLKKKTSRYALPTNPTRSDKPYPTPPRGANAQETNALSLTPDCVYDEMQYTSLRVTDANNNTLVARRASSTTA